MEINEILAPHQIHQESISQDLNRNSKLIDQVKQCKKKSFVSKKQTLSAKFYKNQKKNHWNHFEQKRYINFLKEQGKSLELPFNEKMKKKVNLTMSKKVRTRTSSQCHSHHQKMLVKYETISSIIKNHLFLFEDVQFVSKSISNSHITIPSTKQRYYGLQSLPRELLQQQMENVNHPEQLSLFQVNTQIKQDALQQNMQQNGQAMLKSYLNLDFIDFGNEKQRMDQSLDHFYLFRGEQSSLDFFKGW